MDFHNPSVVCHLAIPGRYFDIERSEKYPLTVAGEAAEVLQVWGCGNDDTVCLVEVGDEIVKIERPDEPAN